MVRWTNLHLEQSLACSDPELPRNSQTNWPAIMAESGENSHCEKGRKLQFLATAWTRAVRCWFQLEMLHFVSA
jgi:hypothetical protein